MVKKTIPHLFTSLNLSCGCLAAFFAFSHQFNAALLFVFLGVFFDFFDGFFARLLNVESTLGVQLDSFADLITCGLTPSVLMYQLFVLSGVKTYDFSFNIFPNFTLIFSLAPMAILAYSIVIGAAFRLARFNLLTEPLPYFMGLPAPANALLIMGLPLLLRHPNLEQYNTFFFHPVSLIFYCFLSVFLMNIHWKMFSLKFDGEMRSLFFPLLLLMGSIAMFLNFGLAALSGIVLLYIVLSAVKYVSKI